MTHLRAAKMYDYLGYMCCADENDVFVVAGGDDLDFATHSRSLLHTLDFHVEPSAGVSGSAFKCLRHSKI